MTPDWILAFGTVIFGVTTWATLAYGYARFRELERRDSEATQAQAQAQVGPPPHDGARHEPQPQ